MAYRYPERYQGNLFPPTLDEAVPDDAPVRAFNAMVDAMNLSELGVDYDPQQVGCPQYDPRTMLKLLVFGYSYGVRSSRRLEEACHTNIHYIWLMGGLTPDHKTIAEFRRYHKKALARVIKACAQICLKLNLIGGHVLFVDGSKFRANASLDRSYDLKKAEEALLKLDEKIKKLLQECEQLDQSEVDQVTRIRMDEKLADAMVLRQKIAQAQRELEAQEQTRTSINLTDPDCARMHSRQGSCAGFNVQTVVDEQEGLIVHNDVTNENNDLHQFDQQILPANQTVNGACLVACADAGYSHPPHLEPVDQQGITVIVPSAKQAKGEPVGAFDASKFVYDAQADEYRCPAGHRLRYGTYDKRDRCKVYLGGKHCQSCPHFGACTTSASQGRKIVRYDNEAFRQKIKESYEAPEGRRLFRQRKKYCEHPFGHIKWNRGVGHFLLRGLAGVRAEASLLACGFNIMRVITLLGVEGLLTRLTLI